MSATVLVVEDDEIFRHNVLDFLKLLKYDGLGATTLSEARGYLQRGGADILVLDIQLPDGKGTELLSETAMMPDRPPIILLTGVGDIEMAVASMKNGAHDFITKPVNFDRLEESLSRATEMVSLRRELAYLRRSRRNGLDFVIGTTPKMLALMDDATRAAEAGVSVLITGESGTGKEMLANAIHRMGPRANKPFIAESMANIPQDLVESTLFGNEVGAYTTAEKRREGLMEIADGGILFLDEIAAITPGVQLKLLRALEERAFRHVGGNNLIHVDVQVLSSSNRDLKAMISTGEFRADLYYRLKVFDLHLPPLRERRQDIPELVGLFIRKYNQRQGKNITDVTPRAMEALMAYDWPGNIRELRNVIERAFTLCDESCIDLPHLRLT